MKETKPPCMKGCQSLISSPARAIQSKNTIRGLRQKQVFKSIVHFSTAGKETMSDKIIRMLKNEVNRMK